MTKFTKKFFEDLHFQGSFGAWCRNFNVANYSVEELTDIYNNSYHVFNYIRKLICLCLPTIDAVRYEEDIEAMQMKILETQVQS